MTMEAPMRDLTPKRARLLTDRIKVAVGELLPLIKEAFEGRADVALGYQSWAEYCDAELRGLRIPIQERREAVQELREAGMDQRSIGAALGVSQKTVDRDLDKVESDESTDSSNERTSMSAGRSYTRGRAAPVRPEVSAAVRDAKAEHEAQQAKRQADRKALSELAEELDLEPDPETEAAEDDRIALLYPLYDAIALMATMPTSAEVVGMVKPYHAYRLDKLPEALRWLTEFTKEWEART